MADRMTKEQRHNQSRKRKARANERNGKLAFAFYSDNADERCLRRQCEISIVCDDGSFSSPKECALALSFSSPKECDKVASKPGFNHTKWD